MKRRHLLIAAGSALLAPSRAFAKARRPRVTMRTAFGTIVIELDPVAAPITAANFLRHLRAGSYVRDATFYRVVHPASDSNKVPISAVQGGIRRDASLPAVAHETTKQTGLRHRDGTLSMARGAPGSATTEFFICIGDNPALDYGGKRNADGQGFAAFGRVVRGMEIVRRIHRLPTGDEGAGTPAANQILIEPVQIAEMREQR